VVVHGNAMGGDGACMGSVDRYLSQSIASILLLIGADTQ
jgi:hypothetical protein